MGMRASWTSRTDRCRARISAKVARLRLGACAGRGRSLRERVTVGALQAYVHQCAPAFVSTACEMRAPSKLFFCLVVVTLANSVYCAEKVTGGSSSSGVGQDVVITTPARQATAMPRRAGLKEQQKQKQQRQQLRQGVPSDPSIPAVGINDATLLPECRPGNGVICSDKDYTGLLGVQPANVELTDDNFAYVGFNPSGEASLGVNTKVDLARRSGSTAAEAVAQGEVKGNVGTDVVTAKTETTNTLAGAGLKNNRLELAVPSKVTITLDKTESENTVDFRTNKPNFYYVLGQNFGLPVGLAKAADGVSGKH